MVELDPQSRGFYEAFWTVKEIPSTYINAIHLRDRMRSELSAGLGRPITWDEIMTINYQELGKPLEMLERPVPEFTWAFMELANAWLVRQYPNEKKKVLAVAQAIGQMACEESAYGPPEDRKTYKLAASIWKNYDGDATTRKATDELVAQILRECF